jgi:ferredoxin-NADP reductase
VISRPTPRPLELVVSSVDRAATDVVVLELRDDANRPLPPFEPGAHLEVYLPNGMTRHYSLCNDSREANRYRIAVGLAPHSRGGSRHIHQNIRPGDRLTVSVPRNNFRLAEAANYCFIAGGIGITPILSMVKWCLANGRQWRLFYCARSRQHAAFQEEIVSGGDAHVRFHFDDANAGRLFDPAEALRGVDPTTHIYCCGPPALMVAVQEARAKYNEFLHFEWFTPRAADDARDTEKNSAFTVVVHSSGRRFPIAPDMSILGTLESNGIDIPNSCREGLCGTCETRIITGIPDHRDCVLSAEQRAANNTMMICVSRSKSDVLELDL